MKFQTMLLLEGKTATGSPVPYDVVEHLGSGKKPAVRVILNDFVYRTTVATMHGVFMIPVSAEIRKRAGVAAGDQVDVEIELDTESREIAVPRDFADALERDGDVKRSFDGLSYSNKRRIVLSIEDAKTPETRLRRIAKSIDGLRDGKI